MKKPIILFALIVMATTAYAQSSMTLTTYYPAPFGAYDRMRLVPRQQLTGVCDIGTMYIEKVDNGEDIYHFCREDGITGAGVWDNSLAGVWQQNGLNIFPADVAVDNFDDIFVGIGTTKPIFKLTLANDGGILAKGTYNDGVFLPPIGAGPQFIWYPRKAAFRAGSVSSTQWEDSSIGDYSVAMGYDTVSSTTASTALGQSTTAIGVASTAMGQGTIASGIASTAMGQGTIASGNYSTALGQGIKANGLYSFGVALNDQTGTIITQPNTMAIMGGNVGIGTTAPETLLHVFGTDTDPKKNVLFEIDTLTLEDSSPGIKWRVTADPTEADDFFTYAHASKWTLYYMKEGVGWASGFMMDTDGNVGIGITDPSQLLHVAGSVLANAYYYSSDETLKENIEPIDGTKILDLNGVRFHWKENGEPEIGLIAQEVEKIYPELVATDPNTGLKSLKYGNLVAPLIEMIKQQQKQINTLKTEVHELMSLKTEVAELQNILKEMKTK
ncbi:MAG: tail fiber domain-containing protein [Candidatus Omnitrophica bacterium]|nr:tail fiber domain-containing protein [Candidatus Omnitrophota bacterium]